MSKFHPTFLKTSFENHKRPVTRYSHCSVTRVGVTVFFSLVSLFTFMCYHFSNENGYLLSVRRATTLSMRRLP